MALFETSFVICTNISHLQSSQGNLSNKETHNVDALVACDTDLGALRTQVDTNDTHGRGVFEYEMAADRAKLFGLDG